MKIRGALKKKANIALIFQLEPKKVDEALKDPSYKLVSKPTNVAIIGSKWVFRNKLNEYGKVVRNKARLVARGYSQQEGDNYDETFTLLSKAFYGLEQAPRAWYERLNSFLIHNGFSKAKINTTLLIKRSTTNFAGDKDDRNSTSGICQSLRRSLIFWDIKKQGSVALSTTEAKYITIEQYCA
uniref:Uncharacterized protein LOC104244323 n=1 Tax=Nicotiana sylvestris TaxID=4096 RepID=A0A1U7Y7X5_NICSY|nr:PREDICTED: uncharacterized protein LOC104244323 [Nicotiana sylvestris]